jgi:Dynamin family
VLNPLHKLGVGRSLSGATAAAVAETTNQPFGTRKIGAELENARRVLMACGQELQTAPPFQGGSFVDDTMQLLARLTCRIAIIGQVKAGKSTFINGLVRRPGLLPTDVNPWTTAVTRLHFGRADAPPNVSAEFTFFDVNEWERLAQGGGLIRELTQRLVPGFEAELLQKHLDAMRRRSEQRLGATLGQLLGKKHAFPALSTEVLERYVCSGQHSSAADHRGIYSDVVKSADLYFRGDDFGFPTTIVDTPGTNDPFLVRDEITRRALESADIYIVMLTARQALSSADVALLRILRGLHKERIAVFINRVDELGDIARDIAPIVEHVRGGLRREFPTTDLPIVVGSALWAETAIRGSDAEIERVLSPKVKAYAQHLNAGASSGGGAGGDRLQEQVQTLIACSGLSALADVLAPLALDSHAGRVLTQISRSFSELGRVSRSAAHHELAVLMAEEKSGISSDRLGEEELRAIDAESKENERLTAALQALLADLQARADRLISDHCAGIVEALREVVQAFSEVECQDLRQAIAEGHRGRAWKCDATLLRQQLEECFIAQYRVAEQEIGKLESHIFPKLKELLHRYHPQWQLGDDGGEVANAELPLLSALSEVVALDLGEPWWKNWWTRRNGEEQVAELNRLIRNEFYPITEALAQAARSHLEARQAATLQEANMVYVGLVSLLREQNKSRLDRTRAMDTDPGRSAASRDARVAELKAQISKMEALVGRLENIEQAWDEKIG